MHRTVWRPVHHSSPYLPNPPNRILQLSLDLVQSARFGPSISSRAIELDCLGTTPLWPDLHRLTVGSRSYCRKPEAKGQTERCCDAPRSLSLGNLPTQVVDSSPWGSCSFRSLAFSRNTDLACLAQNLQSLSLLFHGGNELFPLVALLSYLKGLYFP